MRCNHCAVFVFLCKCLWSDALLITPGVAYSDFSRYFADNYCVLYIIFATSVRSYYSPTKCWGAFSVDFLRLQWSLRVSTNVAMPPTSLMPLNMLLKKFRKYTVIRSLWPSLRDILNSKTQGTAESFQSIFHCGNFLRKCYMQFCITVNKIIKQIWHYQKLHFITS